MGHSFLDQIRYRITEHSETGRVFSSRLCAYNRLMPPDWVFDETETYETDPRQFRRFYQERRFLFKYGVIRWGYVVMANSALFEEGDWDAPAVCVYSQDEEHETTLDDLAEAAHLAFKQKGNNDSKLGRMLTHELAACFDFPLQGVVTDQNFLMTTIMLPRKHLASGKLSESWLPFFVAKPQCRYIAVVPSYYWPEEMVDLWV